MRAVSYFIDLRSPALTMPGEYRAACDVPGRDWGQEEKGTTEDEMAG